MKQRENQKLATLGPSTYISIAGRTNVPAKIDTGAGASSIWASHIRIDKDNVLKFRLFGEGSPFYNGKVICRKEYKVSVARSAMGEEQIRYKVYLPIMLGGRSIRVLFSLSDRSRNSFPVLIGKSTLSGKFLVDVSLPNIKYDPKPKQKLDLETFRNNPHQFHKQYFNKGEKS